MTAKLSHSLRSATVNQVRAEIAEAWTAVERELPRARANLHEWAGALTRGGEGGRNPGISNPTLAAVQRTEKLRRDGTVEKRVPVDPYGQDLICLDARLLAVRDAIHELAIATRRATSITDLPGAEGCTLCDEAGEWQERYQYVPELTERLDKRGKLLPPKMIPLCSWHVDFRQRYQVDAPTDATSWHLANPGSLFSKQRAKEFLPAEVYARYHGTNWAAGGMARR